MNKKLGRVLTLVLCCIIGLSACVTFTGCSNGSSRDSIVIMTEELSGLFNPFYATSGPDIDVVGMTQIGMLTTDSNGKPVAGDEKATAVKAFDKAPAYNETTGTTTYTFVLKNNLKFSDGKPLTMNDVLFNMYEYLDPVYTGSSTMYSIDIVGLKEYRMQSTQDNTSTALENSVSGHVMNRIYELLTVYEENALVEGSQSSYNLDEAGMKAAIAQWSVSEGYKAAVVSTNELNNYTEAQYQAFLLADYEFALETFRKELESDYKAAKESYDTTTAPYSDWTKELESDIFKFFLYEGYITPKYEKVAGKENKAKITEFDYKVKLENYKTESEAIARVYNDTVKEGFNKIITQWGTAGTLETQFAADATTIVLQNYKKEDGSLTFPNISGIVSLGHTTSEESVTIDGKTYKVAHTHNADGTPTNSDEYDVLQVTINGVDPKAIYNFGFTVAPAHYYSADAEHPNGRTIDIANNQFGVEWASSTFQSKVIQSQEHVEVPVGAGAFVATNENNDDNPRGDAFWKSSVVYFKANDNFMFDVKADKIRMQVVSSSNALDKLQSGEVDYVTPQFTKANAARLTNMEKDGYLKLDAWQLGYGYIGINAGKVPNINIRKAIMSAMQTSLALESYQPGTCKPIDWPMSTESWAYPFEADGETSKENGHDYTQWTGLEDAKKKIKYYSDLAPGESKKITFTIAGASITEHPTYYVFKEAAQLLNDLGWEVDVKADSQALTKLATGSLQVWAAAWGSTVDPDMYQVYHLDSKATSVYAWGYREIKEGKDGLYSEEYSIVKNLSKVIDEARETLDESVRTAKYEIAMGYVLDLAVELPVYQRKTLYAYNSKTIKGLSSNVNPYTSPLEKIWELELVQG